MTLLNAGLYFSIQPDKIRESESSLPLKRFIVRLFISNLKSAETKSQIKADLSHLAKSYFYNYKPSLCILSQHCVLRNLMKNKDIIKDFFFYINVFTKISTTQNTFNSAPIAIV